MEGLLSVLGSAALLALIAFVAVKILRASRTVAPPIELVERVAALEGAVQGLQQELAETQERLDFAERLLTKAREERSH